MTTRTPKLIEKLEDAHRHWHAAAMHKRAAWYSGKLINAVTRQLTPKEHKKFFARYDRIYNRKARREFIIPDILALTIETAVDLAIAEAKR